MEDLLNRLPANVDADDVLEIARWTMRALNQLPGSLPDEDCETEIAEQIEAAFGSQFEY